MVHLARSTTTILHYNYRSVAANQISIRIFDYAMFVEQFHEGKINWLEILTLLKLFFSQLFLAHQYYDFCIHGFQPNQWEIKTPNLLR